MSDDDRGGRRRRSWSEIDKMRDGGGRGRQEPRARDDVRSQAATQRYVRKLDHLFSKKKGGADAERLVRALRAAHGTPGLAEACRAYRDALGIPTDPGVVSLFLDARDPALVCEALGALAEHEIPITSGLRTQLRMLAQDSDDDVAAAAEDVLERRS